MKTKQVSGMTYEDVKSEILRRKSNSDKVLAYLQDNKEATNIQLSRVGGLRYGARLKELRETYRILTIPEGGGKFRYVFMGRLDEE